MENNEDTNTNMMDLLPNEMVIKIFEHFENMTDLSTLPKVNHRFNELSKLKCYRNHLLIEDNEIAAYCEEEFNMKIVAEINKPRDLKAVTFITSLATGRDLTTLYESLIIQKLRRNREQEIDEMDIDRLSMITDEFSLTTYLKKSAGDMSRVVQMVPPARDITAKGAPKLFLSAIEKSTDSLINATYEGTNVTLAHLHALGECKHYLCIVELTGNLVVSEEVPDSFQNIQAQVITLKGNFHCPFVADLFFSENLVVFTVCYSTIAGFKNELLTKCTKLESLKINMESERENIPNDQVAASIIELVNTVKFHETLMFIHIYNVNQSIPNSLHEPLSVCLESFPESMIITDRVIIGGPAILIILKR